MLTWLAFVGPGVAALAFGIFLGSRPDTKDAAPLAGIVGFLWLLIVGPIYRRRRKARLQARGWYDRERHKEPYRRRLSRTR